MSAIVEGSGEFLRIRTNAVKLDNDIKAAIRKLTRDARADLIKELSKPGTGRSYGAAKSVRIKKRLFLKDRQRPAYTASSPGRPPARMSGNLLNSVRTKYPAASKGYGAKVYATKGLAFYRHFLEFGAGPAKKGKRKGAGGVRLARPVFTPLQAKLDGKAIEAIQQAVNNFGAGA